MNESATSSERTPLFLSSLLVLYLHSGFPFLATPFSSFFALTGLEIGLALWIRLYHTMLVASSGKARS